MSDVPIIGNEKEQPQPEEPQPEEYPDVNEPKVLSLCPTPGWVIAKMLNRKVVSPGSKIVRPQGSQGPAMDADTIIEPDFAVVVAGGGIPYQTDMGNWIQSYLTVGDVFYMPMGGRYYSPVRFEHDGITLWVIKENLINVKVHPSYLAKYGLEAAYRNVPVQLIPDLDDVDGRAAFCRMSITCGLPNDYPVG